MSIIYIIYACHSVTLLHETLLACMHTIFDFNYTVYAHYNIVILHLIQASKILNFFPS